MPINLNDDDNEPLTQSDINEANGKSSHTIWSLHYGCLSMVSCPTCNAAINFVNVKTRGQLRRLVAALKGEL